MSASKTPFGVVTGSGVRGFGRLADFFAVFFLAAMAAGRRSPSCGTRGPDFKLTHYPLDTVKAPVTGASVASQVASRAR